VSRYRHVSVMNAAGFAVRAACRAAGVSSGYCEWKDKGVVGPILPPSPIAGGDTSFPWFGEVNHRFG